ncbi:tandem-95 repeat protein [Candidatus Berkiella cookevillensis]|uniref:Probable pectate lyase C n=1 Tax=Candidatus Berkiella cookevillensis TaxID=437022 RepID=A0A0Q9YI97_9GAMM|nr:Ig-like domain-containing protein [Candidatus Berkiella cookevillensis]MCS5708999.1 tandem-95 repeat protein [Candidatus Berkiella cookevillensis]
MTEKKSSEVVEPKVKKDSELAVKLDANTPLIDKVLVEDVLLSSESAILPFEGIFTPFHDAFLEYVEMDDDAFEILTAFTQAPAAGGEQGFLDMNLEELLNVVLEDGGTDPLSIVQAQREGGVESISRDTAFNRDDVINKFRGIDSVERDLFTHFQPPTVIQEVSLPPILPGNGLPSAPNLLAGPSIGFHQFESALRTQSSVTLTGNIFAEGASAGPDGLGSLDLSSTRPGSLKSFILGGIEITTPEGNTMILYTSAIPSLGINVGDYVYTLNNPILHLPNDTTDIGQDFNGDLVYINTSLGQIYIDKFIYTIVDGNGDSATAFLSAQVVDDEPTATDNTNAVNETSLFVNGVEAVSGNLLTDNDGFGVDSFGADGGKIVLINGVEDGGVGDLDGLVNGSITTQTDYDTGNGIVRGELTVTLATGAYTFSLVDAKSVPDSQLITKHVSTYTIMDNDGDTSTKTLEISIDLNQRPDAVDDAISINEDSPIIVDVLSNDIDPDSPSDTIQITNLNTTDTIGNVSFDTNGKINYDPNNKFEYLAEGEEATDTFTYTVRDAEGLEDTATVTVTIKGVNDLPTLTGDSGAVTEDAVLAVAGAINFADIDTTDVNTLSVTSADGNSTIQTIEDNADGSIRGNSVSVTVAGLYGSLVLFGDGTWEYTLNNAHAAVQGLGSGGSLTENFAVNYADAVGSAAGSIIVTINGTNDLPTLTGAVGAVTEDAVLTATGAISFADVDVTDVNTLSVTSADGNSTIQTIQDNADGSIRGNSVSVTVAGLYGSLVLFGDGTWEYTLNNNHAAVQGLGDGETLVESFAVSYGDAVDNASGTIDITINGTNDAPVVNDVSASGNEDAASIEIVLSGSDVDGTIASFNVSSLPSNGILYTDSSLSTAVVAGVDYIATANALSLYFVPDANFNGDVSFEYGAKDDLGLESLVDETATITVISVNDAPVVNDVSASGNEDADSITVILTGSDVDGTIASFNVSSLPSNGTLYADAALTIAVVIGADYIATANSLTLYFVPAPDFNGDVSFEYGAKDDLGLESLVDETATITVISVNDAPVVNDVSASGDEDADSIPVILTGSDVDGTIASFNVSSLPSNGTLYADAALTTAVVIGVDYTAASNALSLYFVPDADFNGDVSFDYGAKDNLGLESLVDETATITVISVNDAPVVNDVSASGNEDADSIPVILTGSDVDGTIASFNVSSLPSNGTLYTDSSLTTAVVVGDDYIAVGNALSLYFVPDADFNGDVSFEYGAKDDLGLESLVDETATITVISVNDAPVVNDVSASGDEDADSIPVILTGSDVDGTIASFNVSSLPSNGTLYTDSSLTTAVVIGADYTATANSLTLYFVPDADFNGDVSFDYGAKDNLGMESLVDETATITVIAVDDTPSGLAPNIFTDENNLSGYDFNGKTYEEAYAQAALGDGLSLREAVILANNFDLFNDGIDDVIQLANGNYLLTIGNLYGSYTAENNAHTGDLDILQNLTIIGAQNTTINGGGIDRVFDVHNSATLELQDLSITGGSSLQSAVSAGGAIYLHSNSELIFSNVNIHNNTGGYSGGGAVYAEVNTNISIENSNISNNSAPGDGAGINSQGGNVSVENSIITGNTVTNSGASGAGIHINGGTLIIEDTTISNNKASGGGSYGGGVNAKNTAVSIDNSVISGNVAGSSGGGINLNGGTLDGSNIDFSGNTALNGGAIGSNNATIVLDDSVLSGNTASQNGGAIYNVGGNLSIEDTTVSGNKTNSGSGGGIYVSNTVTTIETSTISGNTAHQYGGGIYAINGGHLGIDNSTISGNSAVTLSGGGIYTTVTTDIDNSTITNNSTNISYNNSGGIQSDGTTSLYSTIVAQNVGNKDISGNYVSDGYNLIGNRSGANFTPQATDITGVSNSVIDAKLGALQDNGGDTYTHALLAGSLAINAGALNDATADQRGGAVVGIQDIGSYEYQAFVPPIILDLDGDGVELLSFENSPVSMFINGVNYKIGWASSDDGILVYDADQDGKISDISEINLSLYHPDAKTDLDGLRLGFDSNQDGIFDVSDEKFNSFSIWRDANGNGVIDFNEMLSLSESGIVHINLNSDNQSSVIEGNLITGYTSYQTTDGNTHLAADVQLQLSSAYKMEPINMSEILSQENPLDLKNVSAIYETSVELTALFSIDNTSQYSDIAYKNISLAVSDIENMAHQLETADHSNPLD